MAQTLVSLYVHVIFSTKNRAGLLTPEIEPDLFGIGGILNNNKSKLLAANGTSDHVHSLISLSKNLGLSELVGDIKRDSKDYIARQKIKHTKVDFKNGFRAILRKYEIEYDERYVWD